MLTITGVQEVLVAGGKELQVLLDRGHHAVDLRLFADVLVAKARTEMKRLNIDEEALGIRVGAIAKYFQEGGRELRFECRADPRKGTSADSFTALGEQQLFTAAFETWKAQGRAK